MLRFSFGITKTTYGQSHRSGVFGDIPLPPKINYQVSVSPDNLLSPATAELSSITAYETATGRKLLVNDVVYLPAENRLVLFLAGRGLTGLACQIELGEDVLYNDGTSAAGIFSETLAPGRSCAPFDVSVASVSLFDSGGAAIIRPTSGVGFTAKITVINAAAEDKTGTLAIFVQGNESRPLLTDVITVPAGKTQVYSYDLEGMTLNGSELFSAAFTE